MSAKSTKTGSTAAEETKVERAKVLANPLRSMILSQLTQRAMSAKGFEEAFPQYSYQQIYGQFRELKKVGYIELVRTSGRGGERRGAEELFYRATERAWFDQSEWASLSLPEREGGTAATVSNYVARMSEATAAGTIDKRIDRHITWTDVLFDKQAWDETIEEMNNLLNKLPGRIAESAARLNKFEGEEIRATVGMTCFESPMPPSED